MMLWFCISPTLNHLTVHRVRGIKREIVVRGVMERGMNVLVSNTEDGVILSNAKRDV